MAKIKGEMKKNGTIPALDHIFWVGKILNGMSITDNYSLNLKCSVNFIF